MVMKLKSVLVAFFMGLAFLRPPELSASTNYTDLNQVDSNGTEIQRGIYDFESDKVKRCVEQVALAKYLGTTSHICPIFIIPTILLAARAVKTCSEIVSENEK